MPLWCRLLENTGLSRKGDVAADQNRVYGSEHLRALSRVLHEACAERLVRVPICRADRVMEMDVRQVEYVHPFDLDGRSPWVSS
jgi:hypothetical protein